MKPTTTTYQVSWRIAGTRLLLIIVALVAMKLLLGWGGLLGGAVMMWIGAFSVEKQDG